MHLHKIHTPLIDITPTDISLNYLQCNQNYLASSVGRYIWNFPSRDPAEPELSVVVEGACNEIKFWIYGGLAPSILDLI